MSILINKDSRVVTQGITGKTGMFHTHHSIEYANGKNCYVAGVTPKKGGQVVELAEQMDPEKLAAGAERVARSDVQRLGWLLERIEQAELADALAQALAGKRLLPTLLTPERGDSGAPLDPRWHVLVNDDVEPDL